MPELERLTARRLGELVEAGTRCAVVPFGSIEHQGGHLPVGADAILADAVGREVARRLDAVLATTVRVGCAEQHRALLGTISLSAGTLADAAVEMASSLVANGFRVIVFVSTHGGNAAALGAAIDRLAASPVDAVVLAPRGDVGPNPGAHSGTWLTSVMLALAPELVDLSAAEGELATELQDVDPTRGAENVERFVASIVSQVRAAIESAAAG